MNHNYVSLVLTLLLTVTKFLTMEGTEKNHLLHNATHLTLLTSQNYTNYWNKKSIDQSEWLPIINKKNVESVTRIYNYVTIPKPILNKDVNGNSKVNQLVNKEESVTSIEGPFIRGTDTYLVYTTEIIPTVTPSSQDRRRKEISTIICNNNLGNQSCETSSRTNITDKITRERKLILNSRESRKIQRKQKRRRHPQFQNMRRKIKPNRKLGGDASKYVLSDGSAYTSYDIDSDDDNLEYGRQHYSDEAREHDPETKAVQYWDGPKDDIHDHHEPSIVEEHKWHSSWPAISRPKTDDTGKDDKMAINKLHDMYHCNKYCHCCKKDRTSKEDTHDVELSPIGKLITAIKRYGFDTSKEPVYSRKFKDRIADSDSKMHMYDYLKNALSADKTLDPDEIDEEVFVFFNEVEEEAPSGVSDCKHVCACCANVKRRKMREKAMQKQKEEQKMAEEKVKENTREARQLNNGEISDNSKISKIGYVSKLDSTVMDDIGHDDTHSLVGHDEHDHDVEEHHDHKFFDCSKCCQFCESKSKRKRKKDPFSAYGGIDLLDFLRGLILDKPPLGDYGEYSYSPSYTDGSTSVSLTGGSNYLYDYNYFYYQPATAPSSSSSSSCCTNTTNLVQVVTMGTAGLLALTGLSSAGMMLMVILPLLGVGAAGTAAFMGLQAATPISFLPLFITTPLIAAVPLAMLGLAPLSLAPAVLPLIGGGAGGVGGVTTNVVSASCIGSNCTDQSSSSRQNGSDVYPIYADDSIDKPETTTLIDINNSVLIDTPLNFTDTNEVERQFRQPESMYYSLKSVLRSEYCLERAGCHLAVYTNSINVYNKFIYRILEMLAFTFKNDKYVSYKDAYQIGSLKTIKHDNCTSLYHCTEFRKYIKY